MNKWPFLQKLLQDDVFSYIDLYFAKRLLGEKAEEETAAALSYLMAISRLGHLCLYIEEGAMEPGPEILWAAKENPESSQDLRRMIVQGWKKIPAEVCEVVADDANLPQKPVCLWKNRLYLQKSFFFEVKAAKALAKVQNFQPLPLFNESAFLQKLEDLFHEGKLLERQKAALAKALNHSLSFICGGPGTGKTYTASYLLQLFMSTLKPGCTLEAAIAAPTGKAAAHLKEKIAGIGEFSAKTLHSLLGIRQGRPFAKKSLPYDVIIVDEASMIDIKLMGYLLESIKEGARLILLGDPGQLPPVDAGSAFADLVQLEKESTTFLERPLRFEHQEIYQFSVAIQKSDSSLLLDLLKSNKQPNLRHLSLSQPELIHYAGSHFSRTASEKIDPMTALQESRCFRMLSCLRAGPFGVDTLNAEILRQHLKSTPYGSWWTAPILLAANDHVKRLYNGANGLVICRMRGGKDGAFGEEDKAYFAQDDGSLLTIPCLQLPRFEWAFCISVHKSQGSEYDHVLLVVPPGSEVFGREVLYTAATRAKQKLELAGPLETIVETVKRCSLRTSGIIHH